MLKINFTFVVNFARYKYMWKDWHYKNMCYKVRCTYYYHVLNFCWSAEWFLFETQVELVFLEFFDALIDITCMYFQSNPIFTNLFYVI